MMPDNQGRGMLETFLSVMRPSGSDDLWQHAEGACAQATDLGAPFKEVHQNKAVLHTWLSWQDPPGRQLHEALRDRVLSDGSPLAKRFVAWFQRLFVD
jgi:hypothetical protein